MPLTPRQLTALHRRQQLALRDATRTQVARLVPSLDYDDLDGSFTPFALAVAGVVTKGRDASQGFSAAYLRALRVAAGLPGAVELKRSTLTPAEFRAALRATSVASIKNATAAGTEPDDALSSAAVLAAGAMARLVLNAGRELVTRTAMADPEAAGFVRVLGGGGCDYCRDMAGAHTDTADFPSHGGCGCTAQPVYRV